MDVKKIDAIIKRVTKKNPKPVLVVTSRRFGKDKRYHMSKNCEVFGCWNGSELWFENRPVRKKGKVVGAIMWTPFYCDNIISIKIATQQDLINYANCLFDILEDIDGRKEELVSRR